MPPPSLPPLFVDRSLGRHVIAEALRSAGETVHAHDDLFPQDTDDEVWLRRVGEAGWIALTKDYAIARGNMLELAALLHYRVFLVGLMRRDLRADTMAALFVSALPRLRAIHARHPPPLVVRVAADGAVSVAMKEREILAALRRRGISV